MAALTAEYEQKVMDRAAAPERQWHTGVYSTLCSEHIMPHDVEILEAFGNTLPTLPCVPSMPSTLTLQPEDLSFLGPLGRGSAC